MSATAEETTKQAGAVAAASEEGAANVQTVASATEELFVLHRRDRPPGQPFQPDRRQRGDRSRQGE